MMEVASVQPWAGSVSKDHSLVVGDASGKSLHGSCHLVRVWGSGLKIGNSDIRILRSLLILKHTVVLVIFVGINFCGYSEKSMFQGYISINITCSISEIKPLLQWTLTLILLNDCTTKSMKTGFQHYLPKRRIYDLLVKMTFLSILLKDLYCRFLIKCKELIST